MSVMEAIKKHYIDMGAGFAFDADNLLINGTPLNITLAEKNGIVFFRAKNVCLEISAIAIEDYLLKMMDFAVTSAIKDIIKSTQNADRHLLNAIYILLPF